MMVRPEDFPVDALNEQCFCLPLDRPSLEAAAAARLGEASAGAAGARLEALAAGQPLFLSTSVREALFARSRAVGRMLLAIARARAEAAGRFFDPEALLAAAVFNSFDFHLAADGPKLIEVNTNAGGAFLQPLFLEAAAPSLSERAGFAPEALLVSAFARLAPGRKLRRVAIVDEAPEQQALYLDMQLAAAALERQGIATDILDLRALRCEGGRLMGPNGPIDMVYNRLVDFLFRTPEAEVLREAWVAGEVIVAPNPDVYRAFADKHLLVALSDPQTVTSLAPLAGADPALILATVPSTEVLDAGNAARLWAGRQDYVFKPADGYGSRGVYRGDKITRSKWNEILTQSYLAQRFAAPSHRSLRLADGISAQKVDIRVWTHGIEPVFAAARLYGGQVTGFRGPGAGFAPILWIEQSCREAGCSEARCEAETCGG